MSGKMAAIQMPATCSVIETSLKNADVLPFFIGQLHVLAGGLNEILWVR